MNTLDALQQSSIVAIDSAAYLDYPVQVTHATTNPSILLLAAKDPKYHSLLSQAKTPLELAVLFGKEILSLIPGHLSIQLDPRFSFDTEATIKQAHQLMDLCKKQNIPTKRILVKIAGTWEGIQAMKSLEKEGIHCNVTMILSVTQAIAAAEAGAACIAPYVGRVTDWYQQHAPSPDDKGILSLMAIYQALKSRQFPTQIMAASFRSPAQVLGCAGCDILTIQPKLLTDLAALNRQAPRMLLAPQKIPASPLLDEKSYRLQMCNDPCACYLLDDGLRRFTKDILLLEALLVGKAPVF